MSISIYNFLYIELYIFPGQIKIFSLFAVSFYAYTTKIFSRAVYHLSELSLSYKLIDYTLNNKKWWILMYTSRACTSPCIGLINSSKFIIHNKKTNLFSKPFNDNEISNVNLHSLMAPSNGKYGKAGFSVKFIKLNSPEINEGNFYLHYLVLYRNRGITLI